jgi:membrane protein required for colicin V production
MEEAHGLVHAAGSHGFFHGINGLDYGIIALLAVSVLMGIIRGFVREAMSLITWVSAVIIAVLYCETVASWFTMVNLLGLRLVLAFVLLILSTLIVGGILSYLVGRLIKFTGFGVTDRIIGTLFGLARGTAAVAIAILLAGPTPFSKDPLWTGSHLIPRFEPVSLWMKDKLPEDLMKKVDINLTTNENTKPLVEDTKKLLGDT